MGLETTKALEERRHHRKAFVEPAEGILAHGAPGEKRIPLAAGPPALPFSLLLTHRPFAVQKAEGRDLFLQHGQH